MKGNNSEVISNRLTRQIFYADVKISRDILGNEWDKRIFLTSLEEARALFRTELYAFCVLDDRIKVLAGGEDVKKRTIRRMIITSMEIFERNTELIGEKNIIPAGAVIKANVLRLDDERDAISVLRFIHLTPSSERYTLSAQDYWWTSYSTYRCHYKWTVVDAEPVMRYLSRNDSRPIYTLSEYHRRGEAMGNPVPDCIKKGEYETLFIRDAGVIQGNLNETFMVHT